MHLSPDAAPGLVFGSYADHLGAPLLPTKTGCVVVDRRRSTPSIRMQVSLSPFLCLSLPLSSALIRSSPLVADLFHIDRAHNLMSNHLGSTDSRIMAQWSRFNARKQL